MRWSYRNTVLLLLTMFAALAQMVQAQEEVKPYECDSIAVWEYCHRGDKPNFRAVEIMQGPLFSTFISIKHDESIKLKNGSLWIVFMPDAMSKLGEHYPLSGPIGFQEFTWDNFRSTVDGLEKSDHVKYDPDSVHKLFLSLEECPSVCRRLYNDLKPLKSR